jgi:hypothetical protein
MSESRRLSSFAIGFLVDGEAFFGADRLPQIAWRLSGAARVSPA